MFASVYYGILFTEWSEDTRAESDLECHFFTLAATVRSGSHGSVLL